MIQNESFDENGSLITFSHILDHPLDRVVGDHRECLEAGDALPSPAGSKNRSIFLPIILLINTNIVFRLQDFPFFSGEFETRNHSQQLKNKSYALSE